VLFHCSLPVKKRRKKAMHGSLLCKAISLLLLLAVSCVCGDLTSDVRLFVYKTAHSEFKKSSDNNYDLNLDVKKNEFVAIRSIQEEQTEVLFDDKISKIIVCSQPTTSRSYNFQNPLSSRTRSGLTMVIELQLDKDEILALRSIQTLEKYVISYGSIHSRFKFVVKRCLPTTSRLKLEALRLRIASALRNILGIDAEYQEGRAPSDSTIDLSKLAVVSDRAVLVPPYYALGANTDLFDLQRNVTSLHMYLYLPKMEIALNRDGIKLQSVLSSVELHEQCIAMTKSSRVLVETGIVAGVEHVILNLPAKFEAKVVQCRNYHNCKLRTMQTIEKSNEDEIGVTWPLTMTMKRSLHKSGFHRELATQIRLSNVKELTPDISKCSLVLVETLSEDYYIDRDEVEGLERFEGNNHFDFFTNGIDIERPAYTSTQHVVVVTSNNKISDPEATYAINFPIHLRYQMPSLSGETHRETYINKPLVYLKCNNTQPSSSACKVPPHIDDLIPLFKNDNKVESLAQRCRDITWIPIESDHVIESLEVSIPTGQLQQDCMVTLLTFGSTALAVAIITYFVYNSPSSKQKRE
jgi:hypothetical protein